MADPESAINIGFARLRIRDLAIIPINQARESVLYRFNHIVVIDQYRLSIVIVNHRQL